MEEKKIELSAAAYANITLEYIAEAEDGTPLQIQQEVERHEYEELIADLLDRTIDCIDSALENASLHTDDIDRVLLVGDATRPRAVQTMVSERLGQDPRDE